MGKVNQIIFFGLFALIVYTAIAMQNRIIVPVRLTFDKPFSCYLPLVILASFIAGMLFCALFTLSCHYIDRKREGAKEPAAAAEETNDKDCTAVAVDLPSEEKSYPGFMPGLKPGTYRYSSKRAGPERNVPEETRRERAQTDAPSLDTADIPDPDECLKCKKEIAELGKAFICGSGSEHPDTAAEPRIGFKN